MSRPTLGSEIQPWNAAEFISALRKAAPALSNKDLVPILSCFCFSNDEVVAYDDVVAMIVPCKPPFEGAVRGNLVLNFLATVPSEALKVTVKDTEVTFRAGAARLVTGLTPKEDFVFEVPQRTEALELVMNSDLRNALNQALVTMGVDPAHPWRMGITVDFQADYIALYTTDNFTCGQQFIMTAVPESLVGKQVWMPPRLCQLLMDYPCDEGTIYLTPDWIEVEFKDGSRLFSRTITNVDVVKYQETFAPIQELLEAAGATEITKDFNSAIDRSLIILQSETDKKIGFEIKDGQLTLTGKSELGLVDDQLPVPGHNDVSVASSPDLIKRCIEGMALISFTNRCVVVREGYSTRLIRLL